MKKMKLAVMHGVGKELTRDELKNVFGGSCSSIQDAACATLSLDASCSSSKIKLYEAGCRKLCDEVNLRRRESKETRGNVSIDKRMKIAMLIGAITMFCNKSVIVRDAPKEGEISFDEFIINPITIY